MNKTNKTNKNQMLWVVLLVLFGVFSVFASTTPTKPFGVAADLPTATAQEGDVLPSLPPTEAVSAEAQSASATETATEPAPVETQAVQPIPLTPSFSLSTNEAKPNVPISISNTTSGTVTSWAWDFGDGTTSTEQNPPPHAYSAIGTYTISLSVSADGTSGYSSQQVVISDDGNVVSAVFAFSGNTTFDPNINGWTVCFADQSQGVISAWAWDFGDGTTSTEQNPCHVYTTDGTYTVKLTVTDNDGATSSAVNVITTVRAEPAPIAIYSVNKTTVFPNDKVTFTDESTGAITAWAWDFGDGTTSTERNPVHQYSASGSYVVTLTVSGNGGSSTAQTSTIIVSERPAPTLTCDFAVGTIFAATSATLDGKVNNAPTGVALAYEWKIGESIVSTSEDLVYTFGESGSYSVTVTVTPEGGVACAKTKTITVASANGAVAKFDRTPSFGGEGTQVCFTDKTLGMPASWAWDFGDGTTSTEQNPCHTYSTPGKYTAKLTVTALDNTTSSASAKVDIYPAQRLSIVASPEIGIAPLTVNLSASYENLNSNTLEWTFPDGSKAYGATAVYTFKQAGDYTVSVSGNGKLGTISAQKVIKVGKLTSIRASFRPSKWNGIAPVEVCFTDMSQGESIQAWAWSSGDGQTSTKQTPCFTYSNDGTYTVTLTVTNEYGLSANATNKIKISKTTAETVTEVTPSEENTFNVSVFDPSLSKIGYLPAGGLGLPGEDLVWEITVTNNGGSPAGDTVVTDTIRPEMSIQSVNTPVGSSVINGQLVTVTIPASALQNVGDSVTYTINTTVVSAPVNNTFSNTAEIQGAGVQDTATVTPMVIMPLAAPPAPGGPIPTIISTPDTTGFAGGNQCFTVGFINQGTNDGFGPYFTIVIEQGANGVDLLSADYLGANLLTAPLLVASGNVAAGAWVAPNDPIEGRPIPAPSPYDATKNYVWYTMRLPVGGVTSGTPVLDINLCVSIDPLADIEQPYTLDLYPGYEFGSSAVGNGPISNLDDITSGMDNHGTITPILVTFDKSNNLPESEVVPSCYPLPPVGGPSVPGLPCASATGRPAFPYDYTLSIELAPGQTITGLTFADTLDSQFELYTFTDALPVATSDVVRVNNPAPANACNTAGTTATFNGSPVTALPAFEPGGGGNLNVGFTSVTNPSSTNTCVVNVTYRGFVIDILGEAGAPNVDSINNTANFNYSWQGSPRPQLSDTDTVDVRNLQIQKSANPTNVLPDDVVTYTLNFQVTEYGNIQTMTITDIIPDGIQFIPGTASITYPGVGTASLTGANATVVYGADTGTLSFNVTGALPGPYAGGQSGTLTYDGLVLQQYRAGGSLSGYVSANDSMTNTLTTNFTLTAGGTFTDTTQATVSVAPNSLTKTLTSTPVDSAAGFVPGEPVTFRLVFTIPSGDTRNVLIEDFFPLPVFDVADGDFGIQNGSVITNGTSANDRILNTTGYCSTYTNATFPAYTPSCGVRVVYPQTTLPVGTTLSVTTDAASNSVRVGVNAPVVTDTTATQIIALDFTMAIIDQPFADNLYLSNLARATYTNSLNQSVNVDAIDYVTVGAPDVQICKGISASTNATSTLAAGAACGVPGAENRNNTNADASDVLNYVVTARNIGGALAYNVVITDTATTLTKLTGCTLTSVTDGSGTNLAFTGSLAAGITLTNPLPGDRSNGISTNQATAIVRYQCTLGTNLIPGEAAIQNTASVVFSPFSDALTPNNHVNPTTGVFPARTDVATVTPRPPTIAKVVDKTTATIGEVLTYTLTVTVPGGTMANTVIADTLDAGLVFVDCISATPNPSGVGGMSHSGGSTTWSTVCNDPTNPVISNGGRTITWNLGTVVNPGTASGDPGTITLVYTTVVTNVVANVGGQLRNNSANLTWTGGSPASLTASAPNVTLVEPAPTIAKAQRTGAAAFATGDITDRDAGDQIDYQLTITNPNTTNGATAHDLVVTDTLSTFLTFVGGSFTTPTNTVGGGTLAGTCTPSESGGVISITITSIEEGESCVVRFSVTLNATVEPRQTLANNATMRWTSLPGSPTNTAYSAVGVERTGNPADPGGAANTYSATSNTVNTLVGESSTNKTITATSESSTGTARHTVGVNDLTIGETVTFQIVYSFREGRTDGVVLSDVLPAGVVMSCVSATITSIGSDITTTLTTASVATGCTNPATTISWTAGTVTTSVDNVANDPDNQIIVQIVARVLDNVANEGRLNNTPDANVLNTGRFTYTDFGGTNRNIDETEPLDIVEPEIQNTKTTVTAMPIDATVGDNVTFRITISHTANSTADAFSLRVSDTLPATMSYTPGSGILGSTTCTAVNDTGSTAAAPVFNFASLSLATGSCQIDFVARLLNTARPNSTYTNTVNTRYDSQPTFVAGETRRKTTPNATSTVTTPTPTIVKTVVLSDLTDTTDPNLNLGEEVEFRLVATLTEGLHGTLIIGDTLPTEFTYVSSRVESIGGNTTNGQTTGGNLTGGTLAVGASCTNVVNVVTCSFGNVTNTADDTSTTADQIAVIVRARVSNTSTTGTKTNNADVRGQTETGTYSGTTTRDVNVVAPNIVVTKTANPTIGDAGDLVTYTVVLQNTGTGPAYNVAITDALPAPFVSYNSGPVCDTGSTVCSRTGGLPGTINATYGSILPAQSKTTTYTVLLTTSVPASGQVVNTANVTSNSRPDNTGAPATTNDPAQVNITPPTVQKVLRNSTVADTTDPNLAVGEVATFDMTAYVPEGTTPDFRMTDLLPVGFQYISSRVEFLGTNITGSTLTVGASGTLSGSDVVFDFAAGGGSLLNTPDGVQNDGDRITVSVTVRILQSEVTNSGYPTPTVKTNTVRLNFTGGLPIFGTANVNIVEPNLTITKTFNPTFVARGNSVTMTFVITNNGTATAYDASLTDPLPTFVSGGTLPKFIVEASSGFSITKPATTTIGTITSSNTGITIPFNRLGVGETITVVVDAQVNPLLVPATQAIPNTATVNYDTLPGDNTNDRDKTTTDDDILQVAPPNITINKYDIPDTNVVAGSTVFYTIVVRNAGTPDIDATGVIVTDTLPKPPIASTGLVTITTTQGTCTPNPLNLATTSTFTCNLGTMPSNGGAGSQAEITFTVPILASTANNTAFTNTARVTDNQGTDKNDPEPNNVVRQLDLQITKTFAPARLYTGDIVTYTLVARNNGLSDASNLVVEDALPAGLTLIAATPALECAASVNPNVSCTFASVPAGQTRTVTVTATVTAVAATNITNNARTYSDESGTPPTTFNNETNTTNNTDTKTFGVLPFGSIGDRVWQDPDSDGVQDAGEFGIAGLTVTLTGTDEFGQPVSRTTTTGANGIYTFGNLKKGTYTVVVTPPANATQTYDLDGLATPHRANNVPLDTGENRTDVDFGYKGNARIGDRVWIDTDGDGVQDVGEQGIPGLTVTLTGTDAFGNAVTYTTTTGANGIYNFNGLFASDATGYTVTVTPPAGVNQTFDKDGIGSAHTTSGIVLASNGVILDVDFGYRGTAALGDRVWYDANGDTLQGGGETGFSGLTVTLTGNDTFGNSVTRTTTTGTNGIYNFTDLMPSDASGYLVTVTPPVNYSATYDLDGLITTNTARATLNAGQVRDDVDFGYNNLLGLISGNVWRDDNNSATKNGTEPNLAGITVDLLGVDELGNVVNLTTTTDANGNYIFPNLNGGNYTVKVVPPPGMVNTYDNLTGNNHDTPVTLPTGGQRTNVNFGYRGLGSLGDRVWHDRDNDATQDAGEVGFVGLTVTLVGTDAYGAPVNLTTTTGANGIYNFTSLPPSDVNGYTVTVATPPAGATQTYDLDGNLAGGSAHKALNVIVEPSGVNLNRTDVDFGYVGVGTVGDTVWYDADADATQDVGELGIPNVTVRITGVDIAGNVINTTTTTDANGNYLFTNLLQPNASGYTVTVTPPVGAVQTYDANGLATPNSSSGVNFNVTNNVLTQDFGYRGNSSIGDRVWEDRDGDRTQDANEPGIPGLTVTLTGRDTFGNPVNLTTTTGANGIYNFPNLFPSDANGYTVTVATPSGMVVTKDRDNNNDNLTPVVLGANQNITDADFGLRGTASLGDRVWRDTNGDTVQDVNTLVEPGLKQLTMRLTGNDAFGNSVDYFTQTDINGYYLFSNLPASSVAGYTVSVYTQPTGYVPSYDLNGIGTPHTTQATLAGGQNRRDVDFGYTANGSIGDRVWDDVDGDGIQDGGENGLVGLTVTLTGGDEYGNPINLVTVTGANGIYNFPNLPFGFYTVSVTKPTGSTNTYDLDGNRDDKASVILTPANPNRTDVDFGYQVLAGIGDRVWADRNGDGVQDANEPGIAGITVTLTGTDSGGNPVSRTTTTDSTGNYFFPNVPASNGAGYTVAITTPPGMTNTYDLNGGNDGTTNVPYTTANTRLDVDFGMRGTGSLGDTIWLDRDADGTQDVGEPGLNGLTVQLTGKDIFGNPFSLTTVTANVAGLDGQYLFTNLPPSDASGYTVTVLTPPANTTPSYNFDNNVGNVATPNNVASAISLAAGQNQLAVDFGYRPPLASLGGNIWRDDDNSERKNGTEPNFPAGIEVTLTGTDSLGFPVTLTTTTDANGNYLFSNIPASNTTGYTVTVNTASVTNAPFFAGFANTFDGFRNTDDTGKNNNISGIVLNPNQTIIGYDFGYRGTGSVGDLVWEDRDNSGTQNGGELGFANVTVTLSGNDSNGKPVSFSTKTDANGNYNFGGLPPSDVSGYTVTVTTPPTGTAQTFDFDGTGTANTANFPLTAGQNRTDIDFGYRGNASLGDRVWVDVDNDGVQDSFEPGQNGMTVTLTGTDILGRPVSLTTTTANVLGTDGVYNFANLMPSNSNGYTVTVTGVPAGLKFGSELDNGVLNRANPNGIATNAKLSAGQNRTDVDFGLIGTGSISGKAWRDDDASGTDNTEPNLPGLKVTLFDSAGNIIATTTTNTAGEYTFRNLPPGNYDVQIDRTDPANEKLRGYDQTYDNDGGLNSRINGISVNNNNITDQNFGYRGTGSIGDTVWRDSNNNGIQDGIETGINGVTLRLTGTDEFGNPVSLTTVTSTLGLLDGQYLFPNLPRGTYRVTVDSTTVPTGIFPTYDLDGFATGHVVSNIVLKLDVGGNVENRTDVDFGYGPNPPAIPTDTPPAVGTPGTPTPPANIIGKVWQDSNRNGVQDPNEVGIPNVRVTATDQFGNTYTTITNSSGIYAFLNIPPGTYTIVVDLTSLSADAVQTYDLDAILDSQTVVSVSAGQTLTDVDFGYDADFVVTLLPFLGSEPAISGVAPCTTECMDFQFYHTNRTGNWEIYRLGGYMGDTNANPNLSQGEGEGVTDLAPSRSPNGEWIAFASNRDGNWEIYVAPTNGDTAKIRRVTYNTIAIDTNPVWGPNNQVVYESSRDGNWNLYMVDMITGAEVRLTDDTTSELNADWSPDGKQIVFQSDRDGLWQLYELDLLSGAVRLLSDGNGNDFDPQYNSTGDKLAFRSYRDNALSGIFTMNRDGSDVVRVSDAKGEASNHTWSPDDSLLAYQSNLDGDLDVYIYDVTTNATRQLTNNATADYAPSWKCGESDVLFTSEVDGNPDIFQAAALPISAPALDVMKDAEQLTDDQADDVYPMDAPAEERASREGLFVGETTFAADQTNFLSPDTDVTPLDDELNRTAEWTTVVGCSSKVCQAWTLYLSNPNDVWNVFRLDDANTSFNLSNGAGDDYSPSLSPDRRLVAFASERDGNAELYVVPSEGGNIIRLTDNDSVDTDPVWSQDGQYLVFESDRNGNFDLFRLDLTTGAVSQLTTSTADETNAFMSFGNGELVYNSNRGGQEQIYELTLVTGAEQRLSDGLGNDTEPVYAFDGGKILFQSDRDGFDGLYIMNRDGSNVTLISQADATARFGAWSPNNEYVAFQSDADGDFDIYIYEVASGALRLLTNNDLSDITPAWRCDSSGVLFTSEVNGNPDIFEVDPFPMDAPSLDVEVDGTQLTQTESNDTFPLGATDELGSRDDVGQ